MDGNISVEAYLGEIVKQYQAALLEQAEKDVQEIKQIWDKKEESIRKEAEENATEQGSKGRAIKKNKPSNETQEVIVKVIVEISRKDTSKIEKTLSFDSRKSKKICVGRTKNQDVSLHGDDEVSSYHGYFSLDSKQNNILFTDVGSTNGTTILPEGGTKENVTKLTPLAQHALQPRDVLNIGASKIKIIDIQETLVDI